jgi:hypothetical protein
MRQIIVADILVMSIDAVRPAGLDIELARPTLVAPVLVHRGRANLNYP